MTYQEFKSGILAEVHAYMNTPDYKKVVDEVFIHQKVPYSSEFTKRGWIDEDYVILKAYPDTDSLIIDIWVNRNGWKDGKKIKWIHQIISDNVYVITQESLHRNGNFHKFTYSYGLDEIIGDGLERIYRKNFPMWDDTGCGIVY